MDPESLAEIAAKIDYDSGQRLLYWGHSHADMSTFFSSTDWATWARLMTSSPDIFVATVHNKKQETPYTVTRWKGFDFSNCLSIETSSFEVDERVESALLQMRARKYLAPKNTSKPIQYNYYGQAYGDYEKEVEDFYKEESNFDPKTGETISHSR